jgi:calcineurin-like phosphoesterase family protein
VHRDAHRYQREFLEVFDSVQAYARRRINGVQALLSHYPYAGAGSDHTDVPRYGQHRLPDLGAVLLHGHTHLADQRLHLSDAGTPQVHVGVDAWAMKPVSLDTITTLLDA